MLEERGGAAVVASMIGTTKRTIERAKAGRAGPRLLARVRAAFDTGEVFDDAREERLALYEARHDAVLGVFDGLPARDAVSVAQLAIDAEREEGAYAYSAGPVRSGTP